MDSSQHLNSDLNDSESERSAYNMAFSELGLEWYWDAQTYAELQTVAAQKNRVEKYIEAHRPHLLRAYDAGFLTNAIESVRTRFVKPMLN